MLSIKSRTPGAPGQACSSKQHRFIQPLLCAPVVFYITLVTTYLSGGLSATEAAGEKGKGDKLGEGDGTAGLQAGVVGDCGLSHWTIGDRVWPGLRTEF